MRWLLSKTARATSMVALAVYAEAAAQADRGLCAARKIILHLAEGGQGSDGFIGLVISASKLPPTCKTGSGAMMPCC
jgi:hypothetical protein